MQEQKQVKLLLWRGYFFTGSGFFVRVMMQKQTRWLPSNEVYQNIFRIGYSGTVRWEGTRGFALFTGDMLAFLKSLTSSQFWHVLRRRLHNQFKADFKHPYQCRGPRILFRLLLPHLRGFVQKTEQMFKCIHLFKFWIKKFVNHVILRW